MRTNGRLVTGSGGRWLCCLLLAVLLAAICAPSARAEDAAPVLNSCGNVNLAPAVDPVENTEGFSAVLYDNRNGLPTSEANAIAQTSDGFIWIGSYAGLIRYDGNTFEIMEAANGILNTRCLYVDSQDRLWIGTNDFGIFLMNRGSFRRVDGEDQLASVSIRSIAETPEGIMYIGTASGAAMVDRELNLTVLEDERITGRMIRDIRMGGDGLAYCITERGDLFTLRDGAVTSFLSSEESGCGGFLAFLPDPVQPGAFYYAVQQTGCLYHGFLADGALVTDGEWEISPLTDPERLESIGGDIWICAVDGIGKLSAGGFRQLENVPMDKLVCRVMTDYEGNLWFASTRQCVMKIVPNRFLDLFARCGLEEEIVNTTCMYGSQLFVGTDAGLIVLEGDEALESVPLTRAVTASGKDLEADDLLELVRGMRVRSILRDSAGRLWISTWGRYGQLRYDHGELMAFTHADGMISEKARTVCECADGSMLVAQPDGVSVIRGDSVERCYGAADGLVVTSILTVTEGFRGEMILGSDGGGIYIIGPDGFRHIGTKDGLKSEVILRIKRSGSREIYWIATGNSLAYMTADYQVTTVRKFPYSNNYDLYENSLDDLWVLSSNGVYVVSAEEMLANGEIDAVYYGVPSGLPYIATSNSFSELTEEGVLYISGGKGAIRVNIDEPSQNINEMKIGLPFVDADGVLFYPDEAGDFILPAGAQKITVYPYVFNYSLTDPQITYRLEGLSLPDTTVSRSKLTPVSYTNLKMGSYSFVMEVWDPASHAGRTVSFRIVKGREVSVGAAGTLIMSFASLLLLGGILVYTAGNRKRNRLEDRMFYAMVLTNLALGAGEALCCLMEYSQMTMAGVFTTLGNTVFHIAVVLLPCLFLMYLNARLDPERLHLRRTDLLRAIPCLLFTVLVLVNLKTGWIFPVGAEDAFGPGPEGLMALVPAIPVWFYLLAALIRLFRINWRLALVGLLLIGVRLLWELWFPSLSSTSFICALALGCIHLQTIYRPTNEVTP